MKAERKQLVFYLELTSPTPLLRLATPTHVEHTISPFGSPVHMYCADSVMSYLSGFTSFWEQVLGKWMFYELKHASCFCISDKTVIWSHRHVVASVSVFESPRVRLSPVMCAGNLGAVACGLSTCLTGTISGPHAGHNYVSPGNSNLVVCCVVGWFDTSF